MKNVLSTFDVCARIDEEKRVNVIHLALEVQTAATTMCQLRVDAYDNDLEKEKKGRKIVRKRLPEYFDKAKTRSAGQLKTR